MLTIAVSSRSLFHLEDENTIFETQGQQAFDEFMAKNEDRPLEPGVAFPLVRKLLALKDRQGKALVRVIILSRNSADAGLRIMKSAQHHGLFIAGANFTAGRNRFSVAKAMKVDLFLSASANDVQRSLENGVAAATILPRSTAGELATDPDVRIALDGDSTIFSSEADDLYRAHGLDRFKESERANADIPLGDGPFMALLAKLCELQSNLRRESPTDPKLIVALVTARGGDTSARVYTTLRHRGVKVDDAHFLDGMEKGPVVKALGVDFFFDDTKGHIESATTHDIPAGHVPFGGGGIIAESAPAAPVRARNRFLAPRGDLSARAQ